MTKTEAAYLMRTLPEADRDAAIDAADNVADLRPVLTQRRRNRTLADMYRKAFSKRPPGGAA